MAADDYSDQLLSTEDVESELNTIERLLSSVSPQDELMEALLHNQRIQLLGMLQRQQRQEQQHSELVSAVSGQGTDVTYEDDQTAELPVGLVGRALTEITLGSRGEGEFQVAGSGRVVDVRANNEIEAGSTIAIVGRDNLVTEKDDATAPADAARLLRPIHEQDSVDAQDNDSGLAVVLHARGRPYVDLYYSVGRPAEIEVYLSNDGEDWFPSQSFAVDDTDPDKSPQEGYEQFVWTARPWVRVRCGERNTDLVLNVGASR